LGSELVKILGKLIGEINTNILWEAFTLIDPKSTKILNNLTLIFAHLGSARVKR